MSFRTIIIENTATLKYNAGYLIIKQEKISKVHISEICTLLIESTHVNLSAYLILELLKHKVNIILCDEMHNPHSQINMLYGSHDNFKKIEQQLNWDLISQQTIWTKIIEEKILNQSSLLSSIDFPEESKMLKNYASDLKLHDTTNREGHSAKVYFNRIFGNDFSRELEIPDNWALDYGYSLILALFNRTINCKGYLTQLGIKHIGKTNPYNLSSDIMEIYRPLIDRIVVDLKPDSFNSNVRNSLLEIFNMQFMINGKSCYIQQSIDIYVTSVFNAIEENDLSLLCFPQFNYGQL